MSRFLFWSAFTVMTALAKPTAFAGPCGGPDQRGCCAFGGDPNQPVGCGPGTVEEPGCRGDCKCAWGLGSSNTVCRAVTPCGGPGERGCCAFGGDPGKPHGCRGGQSLYEEAGCTSGCRCAWGLGSSDTMCLRASACGGEGQRACCAVGEEASLRRCNANLVQVDGCKGECRCAGTPFSSSTTCAKPPPPPPLPPPPPPPSFSTPSNLGCGPFAPGVLGVPVAPSQRAYQAALLNATSVQQADNLCRSGVYTITIGNAQVKPVSCGQGYAIFVVDDATCSAAPASQENGNSCTPADHWFCAYVGTPPNWTTKYDTYKFGCKDAALAQAQAECSGCRVQDGECGVRCGDGVRDFGEECDTGGPTATCTAACAAASAGRELRLTDAANRRVLKHQELIAGSGFLFGSAKVSKTNRDVWWNGRELVPFDAGYAAGEGSALDIKPIDTARFERRAFVPRVGQVFVFRFGGSVYAATRITRVDRRTRSITFDWITF